MLHLHSKLPPSRISCHMHLSHGQCCIHLTRVLQVQGHRVESEEDEAEFEYLSSSLSSSHS